MLKTSLAALAAFIAFVTPSIAHDYTAGNIQVVHPWSRPTPPSAKVGGGYVKLTNAGSEPDRLIAITSPIASRVEIHRSVVEHGVASMRPVGGVTIEPGATVSFEAEHLHFMFIEPNRQLRDGDRFPATLVFERAGRVDVEFIVQMRAFTPAAEDHSGHGGSQ